MSTLTVETPPGLFTEDLLEIILDEGLPFPPPPVVDPLLNNLLTQDNFSLCNELLDYLTV